MENNNEEKITIEKMMLIQKSLAIMVKEKEKTIQSLKKELEEKDKEINRLKELNSNKNKLDLRKPEEVFKFSKNINISDIKELKQHYDSEKLFLSDLISTLKKDIEKKNVLSKSLF